MVREGVFHIFQSSTKEIRFFTNGSFIIYILYILYNKWPHIAPPRMPIGVRPELTIYNAFQRDQTFLVTLYL